MFTCVTIYVLTETGRFRSIKILIKMGVMICFTYQKIMSEHEEQSLFVHWFRLKYPKFKEALFAIPNGGHRHIRVAMTLKKEGVVPGVSDMFLMVPRETFHGAFIEMKTKTGRLSDKQKKFLSYAEAMGYKTIVGYGYSDVTKKLKII